MLRHARLGHDRCGHSLAFNTHQVQTDQNLIYNGPTGIEILYDPLKSLG